MFKMSKKRSRKVAKLEALLEYLAEAKAVMQLNEDKSPEYITLGMSNIDSLAEALIDAIVAYAWMPINVAAAVVITSIFWLGIVWPIVSVI